MKTRNATKMGFTLIELVVTMAISGIFVTLAFKLYSTANRAFLVDRKSHEAFFKYNVKSAKTERMLHLFPGECKKNEFSENTTYSFTGDSAYIRNQQLPFSPLQCKAIDKKRFLVYYRGRLDSSNQSLIGFSTIVDR